MRTVFMGTPAFSVSVLRSVMDLGHQAVGVYTQPDKPAGRGRRLETSPVKRWAQELGIPVFQPRSLKSEAAVEELAALAPDLLVVAAYGKILPPALLALPTLGAAMRRCRLVTPDNKGRNNYINVNVYELLYKGNLKCNLILKPGDVLYVPSTMVAKIVHVISPVTGAASQTTSLATQGVSAGSIGQ